MNSTQAAFENLSNTSYTTILASVAAGACIGYVVLSSKLWKQPKAMAAPSSVATEAAVVVDTSVHAPILKETLQVPFVVIHDPAWKDIGRALEKYDDEVAVLMNGLSRALEVATESEWDLFVEGVEPQYLLAKQLQLRIDRMAVLLDENTRLLQQELLQPFPVTKLLPKVYPEPDNVSIKNMPLRKEPPHRVTKEPLESSSYDSVSQVIVHIARDWTRLGLVVRQRLYDWCKQEMASHLVAKDSILVPGAGLGRLAFDLACDGYSVEANEISVLMSSAAHAILQRKVKGTLRPFLMDYFTNEVYSELRYESVPFPDVDIDFQDVSGSLSFTLGDFVETYSMSEKRYEGIVTCFFLDTATNIYEYLWIISNALKVGGVWVNVGPLQWHRNAVLHPSADEIRGLVESFGFEIVKWSLDLEPIDYRYEDSSTTRSTKYEAFKPLRMVAIRRETTKSLLLPRFLQRRHKPKQPEPAPVSSYTPSNVVIEEL